MAALTDYTRFIVALFAILAPFAAVPIFLSLTEGQSDAARRRTAATAAATVAGVLMFAAITGDFVLTLLGTSLDSFRVGGGLVLLIMALSMLSAKVSPVQRTEDEAGAALDRQSIGVVPLGLPLLAGPGSISNVIIEANRVPSVLHVIVICAGIALVAYSLYWALRLAVPIGDIFGKFGLNIVNRLFGLLLSAIAVELMASGLRSLFPGLN